ncbi:MAG: 16S rRNA (uracil(1498)-N(3))-methyltransferase [Gammaproteobacteria bacterium TMED1]|nr:MAG: 16S rRNA (uracil(1498)-N(3))-methyltransferase [Gammaproteobacteria bacterium TMED1]|tara:strand:+ start:751 stop:1464 length:714 start_codon:yes stop_codon:yes gene_type:complete
MIARRFYLDQALEVDKEFVLPVPVSHHAIRVLRMNTGQRMTLFNGDGFEYESKIVKSDRSGATVFIESKNDVDRESKLISRLGLGMLKRKAMESALSRATELGVTEITPLRTSRSNVNRYHENHWKQVIHSSCEQCGRNQIPRLQKISSVQAWLATTETPMRLVAHPGSKGKLKELTPEPAAVSILVGPEGGLESKEIKLALDYGFLSIDLGRRVLRAETVPAALISIIQYCWGDIS